MNKITKIIAGTAVGVAAVSGIVFGVSKNNNKEPEKNTINNEYKINEEVETDKLNVKLNDVYYNDDKTGIEVSFDITNNSDKTITIDPEENFKIYNDKKEQLKNTYQNETNIIKKGETLTFTLHYESGNKESYDISFVSDQLKKDIKFNFKSTEVKTREINGFG